MNNTTKKKKYKIRDFNDEELEAFLEGKDVLYVTFLTVCNQ